MYQMRTCDNAIMSIRLIRRDYQDDKNKTPRILVRCPYGNYSSAMQFKITDRWQWYSSMAP